MNSVRNNAARVFIIIGFFTILLMGIGLVLDYRAIDPTQGGYTPPYENYTGNPIDWNQLDTTQEGMVYRGFVLDILINCRTGMVSFETYRYRINWRKLSPRALAVHEPQTACRQRGFSPKF